MGQGRQAGQRRRAAGHMLVSLPPLHIVRRPSIQVNALPLLLTPPPHPPSSPRRASVGDLDTVFAQRANALSPSFLRMLRDVVRFGREAPEVLPPAASAARWRGATLAQYLEARGYGDAFRRHYLLPMCAAVWSVPNAQVLEFPVQMLVRFW